MKVEFWMIGKTAFPYLEEGINLYRNRIERYLRFQYVVVPDVKPGGKMPPSQVKSREGEAVLKKLNPDDLLILLDEAGNQMTSVQFASFMEHQMQSGPKRIVFLVGGAWGFSREMYERANHQLSLSKMTFSHQMIRLFFLEQLYRAMTIIRGEPYHNE